MAEQVTPRIYVASLTDYNAGTLHGVWIDADSDVDTMAEEIATMLAASPEARSFPQGGPAEEYAIHDYEGFPRDSIGEYSQLSEVVEIAEAITEHGADVVAAFFAVFSVPNDAELSTIGERYQGCWDSEEDYAMEWAESTGAMEVENDSGIVWPFTHVDWQSAASELFSDLSSVRGPEGLYVFRSDV